VHAKLLPGGTRRDALLQELSGAHYDLLVVGLSRRPGAQLFLGNLAAQTLERADASLLFVGRRAGKLNHRHAYLRL